MICPGQVLEVGKLEISAHLPTVHLAERDGLVQDRLLSLPYRQGIHDRLRRWVLKRGDRQPAAARVHHRLMIRVLEPPVAQILRPPQREACQICMAFAEEGVC